MNTEKIDFALKHGTSEQTKAMIDWIHKLNVMAEKVWFESKVKDVSFAIKKP